MVNDASKGESVMNIDPTSAERRAPSADTVRESGIANTAATLACALPTHASWAAVPAPAVTSASCKTPPVVKENARTENELDERMWGVAIRDSQRQDSQR